MHPDFIPAATLSEAITRIEWLTGATLEDTRGEKRALLALRDALGLSVSTVETGAVLGAALAERLDVEWIPALHLTRTMVTLEGLNALLAGATEASLRGELHPITATPVEGLAGPEWADFQPAGSKIEAVTRISALTNSGPERLGPGGKEHKRVLINLANGMLPGLDQSGLSKTGLAAAIADELGVPWGDHCISTQQTIRLTGLNVLLAGAERRLHRVGNPFAYGLSPVDEATALLDALQSNLLDPAEGGTWDGRAKTLWLRDEGTRHENHTEWAGWYFEFRGRDILNRAFRPNPSPPQARFANTTFDYSLNHVWDLKAHSSEESRDVVILNDIEAMRECIGRQGLGLLILHGTAIPDSDGSFKAWHDAFKGRAAAVGNTGRSRMRKAAFIPTSIEAVWIPDLATLDAALESRAIGIFRQGRQADGTPRRLKYSMRLSLARELLPAQHRVFPLPNLRLVSGSAADDDE